MSALVYLTDDKLVQEGPGVLNGFMFDCDTDGGTLTIYDGMDADSGRTLLHVEGWQYDINHACFSHPVEFETGLYVVLDANVSDASINYTPKRSYSVLTVESVIASLQTLLQGQ